MLFKDLDDQVALDRVDAVFQRIIGLFVVAVGFHGRCMLANGLGQMLGKQFRATAHQDSLLHGVFHLSDVARPGENFQQSHRLQADVKQFLAELRAEACSHSPHQRSDVLAAFAEGRQVKGHHVQTVVKILSELALTRGLFQIPVTGHNNAGFADLCLVAAHGLVLARLDDTQQARLLFQAQRVDLVEQNAPLARRGELADLGTVGARKGTLGVTKERGFDQVRGLGSARNRQERMSFPGRTVVHQPGKKGFAGAGLSGEQNGNVVHRRQANALDHRQERGSHAQETTADDLIQGFFARPQKGIRPGGVLCGDHMQTILVERPAEHKGPLRFGEAQFLARRQRLGGQDDDRRGQFLEREFLNQSQSQFGFGRRCDDQDKHAVGVSTEVVADGVVLTLKGGGAQCACQ